MMLLGNAAQINMFIQKAQYSSVVWEFHYEAIRIITTWTLVSIKCEQNRTNYFEMQYDTGIEHMSGSITES